VSGVAAAAAQSAPSGPVSSPPQAPISKGVPPLAITSPAPTVEAIADGERRAVAWLLGAKNGDGSWGGARNTTYTDVWPNVEAHRSWTVATTGLAVMALLRLGKDEPHASAAHDASSASAAIDRGIDYVVANHDLRRPDSWDVDDVWGLLYGLQGLADALHDPRFADSPRRDAMRSAAAKMVERAFYYQSPTGGWAYYTDEVDAWRPQWSTSFTTAAMIGALCDARAAGLEVDAKRFDAAVRTVAHCRLPEGAFTYNVSAITEVRSLEGIDDVRGSLGRIPACDLALALGGRSPSERDLVHGYDLFFREHMYLDCARMRPIPHEAYHKNAGYFYLFGHFYAGELLGRLPAAARKDAASKLAFEVLKTQEKSGASWDYYMADYGRPYGTAFAAMALGRVLEVLRPASAPTGS
jgi:hypothetical protein